MLVNDIWGAEVLKGGPAEWNTPIWEHDLDKGLRILRLAIDTHLITSHHLLPLLIDEPGGLLVEVTDGTAVYNASRYRISVFYDLAKSAVNRLAFSQGHELASHAATAVAITPGWLRSEIMLDAFGVSEAHWRDSLDPNRAGGYPLRPTTSRCPSPLATSGAPSSRWLPIPIAPGGTSSQSPPVNSRPSTGSPTSMATRPDVWRFMEEIREHDLDANPDDYR